MSGGIGGKFLIGMFGKSVAVTTLLRTQAARAALVVRLRPFDTSTPEGRSRERHRRVALSVMASVVARSISILTMLISVPLTVGYLGAERYGLWMTISSVTALLGFADLGMGNGLLNAVSEANGRDDREMAQKYISSAFFLLSGLACVLAVCFAVTYPWIPWAKVFNVSSLQAVAEAGPGMAVFIGCFLVSIPLGVVTRVQLGYQEGFTNSLWTGFGNLLGLGGVLVAIYLHAGLPWLVLAMAGAPVLASLLNGLALFGFRRPWLRVKWDSVNGEAVRRILHLGVLFLVLQLAVALAYASDNIIASHVLGPSSVAEYSVVMRMFSIAPVLLGMLLGPLWPAYGESIARGDVLWVKRTLRKSLLMSFICSCIPSAFLVIFGGQIIRRWVGAEVSPSFLLLLGFGTWTIIGAVGNSVALFLNGANIIKFQVIVATLMSVVAICLKIILASSIGLQGIIWATVISYTIFTVIPYALFTPKILTSIQKRTLNA